MRIIVNSDDLGACESVNASIFGLMEKGRVTSATLLTNFPGAESAAREMRNYPHCSFGVHLNVTEFFPLTDHPGLKPLLTASGEFANNIRGIPLSRSVRQGVFAEWSAQVERALALGVPVSHLDGHHHCHTVPGLFGVLKGIQRKFDIRKVRITRNIYSFSEEMPRKLAATKKVWNFALKNWFPTQTTEGFCSFSIFFQRLQARNGLPSTIELMCHPGHENYRKETELLAGPWKDFLPRHARLISYNEL